MLVRVVYVVDCRGGSGYVAAVHVAKVRGRLV